MGILSASMNSPIVPRLTAGRKDPGINQICEDCVQIIFKFVPFFDRLADLINAKLRVKALEKKIADMKGMHFIHNNTGALPKIDGNFSVTKT